MPRQVTVAGANRYCQVRLRAAKYNEDFLSRAKAVEHLPGVTEDSLKKYELDIVRTPNTVVALMADAYNAPELRSWYCANECPLGRDRRSICEMPAERTLLRLMNAKGTIDSVANALSEIMDDGEIDEQERELLPQLREELLEVKLRAEEALALMERTEKLGKLEI